MALPRPEWRASVFGIVVQGSFAAPGLAPGGPVDATPPTVVDLAAEDELRAGWPARTAQRLLAERLDGADEPARWIDHAPGAGYLLRARHFGLARVAEDGRRVACAPLAGDPWRWQRFLVGRVLPWAAVLRGREILHASAVTIGGRAIAVVGASGVGKSSLAARLVLAGARLMTDDVLALSAGGSRVCAHPGPGLLALRPAEWQALSPTDRARLGRVLGHDVKRYVEVEHQSEAQPLAALYFARRGRDPGPAVRPLKDAPFRALLAASLLPSLDPPERRRRRFELCADVTARVALFSLHLGAGDGAGAVADHLADHAAGLPEPPR